MGNWEVSYETIELAPPSFLIAAIQFLLTPSHPLPSPISTVQTTHQSTSHKKQRLGSNETKLEDILLYLPKQFHKRTSYVFSSMIERAQNLLKYRRQKFCLFSIFFFLFFQTIGFLFNCSKLQSLSSLNSRWDFYQPIRV